MKSINPRTKKGKVLGIFTLGRDKKVKDVYKDPRFKFDIMRQGVRVFGRTYKPEDGPGFMGALEKYYGSKTFYEVVRS